MNWLLSTRRLALVFALASCTTIASAFLMPVHSPETSPSILQLPVDGLSVELAAMAGRDKHGTLLASRRWGKLQPKPSKADTSTVPDLQPVPGINPELLKMNFVGLIAVQDQRIVLLKVPKVGIVRYVAGDTLPDGRVLVSVTDNSLRLKAKGLPGEELLLFPPGKNVVRQPGWTEPREFEPEASR